MYIDNDDDLEVRNAYDEGRDILLGHAKCTCSVTTVQCPVTVKWRSIFCLRQLLAIHYSIPTITSNMSGTESDEQVMKQIRARLMQTGDWQR